MASDSLVSILDRESGETDPIPSGDAIDRVLTEPHQEQLAEAIAADAIDAAPILGDIMAMVRFQKAEEQGIEYPERPAFVENVLSDIPAPLDTIGDIIVSQNVLHYLEREYDLEFGESQENLMEAQVSNIDDAVEAITPDTDT